MHEKQIFNIAADAYRQGKNQNDNPFDDKQSPDEHEAWSLGFGEESAYWEH